MYNISTESIQKIFEIQKLINNIEIKGAGNVLSMYNTMVLLQNVVDELQKTLKEGQNIVIDNTKEVENDI